MIYYVTKQPQLIKSNDFIIIDENQALDLLRPCKKLQFDTETDGLDAHLCKLLCMQFGNDKQDIQIVVDCTTISPLVFKEIIETKFLIGQNLKFDLQFLYNYKIIPNHVYDTMIAEQFLWLGYSYQHEYSLKSLCRQYLHIEMSKEIRSEISSRGLDTQVIMYAANDVKYLERIMWKQLELATKKQGLKGIKLECACVPAMAYLEWCGIKLDEDKWKSKMDTDKDNYTKSLNELNNYTIEKSIDDERFKKFITINRQGDLFTGFDTTPKVSINWDSAQQVTEFVKLLGFNVDVKNKKTGNVSESVGEKNLSNQKGIDDKFLKLYFDYKGYSKVIDSFGQTHLNSINPKTGRLHTIYNQIGAISGRMSSGGGNNNDVAKARNLPIGSCKNVNMQQLPHDEVTRSCFVSEKGYNFCSCDYSAMEARLGAMVYNEKTLIDEFLYGSGDSHAAYAKAVFSKELEGIDVKDVKKLRPDLRNKVKSVEFSVQFGSDGTAAAPQLGIPVEDARTLVSNLLKNMKGLANYKITGSKFVKEHGYVVALSQTGHKVYMPEWNTYKKNPYMVSQKVISKWDRYALNIPTQGGGACVIKTAYVMLWKWILSHDMFGKIKIVNITHDEINSEYPEGLTEWPKVVADTMEKAGALYYKVLPLPAEPAVGKYWIH